MTLLLFYALALGTANLLVHEGPLDRLRDHLDRLLIPHNAGQGPWGLRLLRKGISCAPCASFWTGAVISLALLSPTRALLDSSHPLLSPVVAALLDGVVAHAGALLYFGLSARLAR